MEIGEVVEKIKSQLEEYGDGLFTFETKDVECLLQAYENLREKYSLEISENIGEEADNVTHRCLNCWWSGNLEEAQCIGFKQNIKDGEAQEKLYWCPLCASRIEEIS